MAELVSIQEAGSLVNAQRDLRVSFARRDCVAMWNAVRANDVVQASAFQILTSTSAIRRHFVWMKFV